jgi:hypothetical protein
MKSLGFLILSMFLCNTAIAEDAGRFTFLGQGHCAPFEGTLFDITATSRLLTLEQELTLECDSRLQLELGTLNTELQLEIDNQRIGYEASIQERDLTITTQQRQISDMQDALHSLSADNKWLWAAGGVLAGVALSYTAYEAFN